MATRSLRAGRRVSRSSPRHGQDLDLDLTAPLPPPPIPPPPPPPKTPDTSLRSQIGSVESGTSGAIENTSSRVLRSRGKAVAPTGTGLSENLVGITNSNSNSNNLTLTQLPSRRDIIGVSTRKSARDFGSRTSGGTNTALSAQEAGAKSSVKVGEAVTSNSRRISIRSQLQGEIHKITKTAAQEVAPLPTSKSKSTTAEANFGSNSRVGKRKSQALEGEETASALQLESTKPPKSRRRSEIQTLLGVQQAIPILAPESEGRALRSRAKTFGQLAGSGLGKVDTVTQVHEVSGTVPSDTKKPAVRRTYSTRQRATSQRNLDLRTLVSSVRQETVAAKGNLNSDTSQVEGHKAKIAVHQARSLQTRVKSTRSCTKSNLQLESQTDIQDRALATQSRSDLGRPKSLPLFESQTSAIQLKAVSARPASSKSIQKSWPQSKRFKRDPPLPPNTICVSTFLKDDEIKQIMPDLDQAVLTRARRRAEGPRGERVLSRRRSSSHKPVNGVQRVSLVNGVKGVIGLKDPPSEIQSGSSSTAKPSSPPYVQVDSASQSSSAAAKPGESISKENSKGKEKDKPLERNIDNVTFGDVTFKAWYPSWYPKEIIGEKGLNGDCKGIVVPDLYVCKKCFGYAKTVVEWVRHTRCCEKDVPGEKVYTHGPSGIWSVWEVDGDVDTLFCQNLSLFAKLFLDNKSVFFDVSGFKYFLLVHNSPTTSTNQIVGFFSKEKMSWDNNNLACILVFPPWQRKSLGTLLMGISYAISRREQILGGPEKPISDLGKKGYKRYWGSEIARWLLDVKESDKKKGRGMVTVNDVSQGTWIVAEDCLVVLREMGVVEKAGKGKGEVERVRLDKVKVREWVDKVGLSLEKVVDEAGFVEGYAVKDGDEDVVMED